MDAFCAKGEQLRFGGENIFDKRAGGDRRWRMRRGTPRPEDLISGAESFRKSFSSSTLDSVVEE